MPFLGGILQCLLNGARLKALRCLGEARFNIGVEIVRTAIQDSEASVGLHRL